MVDRPPRRERKLVTVVFVDLVGFTSRAETLDPEDVEAILRPYHERVRSELERFGGTVEKFIGDAVMAVFGAPVVHEDDPERAVRAALAIRDWAVEQGAEIRVAVNTGEVLVSVDARPEAGEALVAGDVVNTASRLQTAAPVNGILVGESTYRATARAIEYRDRPAVEAKGKADTIRAREAVRARSRFGVDLAPSGRGPLVGRDRELDILCGALARVRDESSPQLLTLVGVPGIGKSRLVGELFEVVDTDPELILWRQGRSLPYGEGVTYWALAEMVKAQAGILESDAAGDADAKLERAIRDVVDDEESEWVAGKLRALVGLGDDGAHRGDTRAEAFAAWRRFLEGVAEQGPLVLVFEDLHWADDGLLDFVDHLVDWASGVPMLLVCTARPELLARRPGWGGGKPNAGTVSLAPLSPAETATLVEALLDRAALPADVQATLLDRAGGNPLYAEEFARIAAEHELDADELPVPESIHGLIAARIDALSGGEKAVLEDAAVVGKVFWGGSVAALATNGGGPVDDVLHALQRKEFVQRERRSAVAGERQYAFRHALVRDVAYGQMPRARRAEKHRLTAGWLELLGRREEHAELLAHHYLSALELARAAGQDVAGLAEQAKAALRVAGDRALALNAARAAARFYRAALDLTATDDPGRPEALLLLGRSEEPFDDVAATATLDDARESLLAAERPDAAAEADVVLADIAWRHGRAEGARDHLESAAALVMETAPSSSKAFVLSQIARFHMLASRNDVALRFGAEASAMADRLGLDHVRADALNTIASARAREGTEGTGIAELEESVAILERLGSVQVLRGYNNLLHLLIEHGELARGDALADRAIAEGERFGYPEWLHWLGEKRSQLWYLMGRWDDVLGLVEQELDAVEAGKPHYLECAWRAIRCLVLLPRGDRARLARESDRALAAGREVGDPQMLDPAIALRARALLELGQPQRALELVDELLAALRVRGGLRSVYWWHLSETAVALDRRDEVLAVAAAGGPWVEAARARARGDWGAAAGILATIGARPLEAVARRGLAEALLAEGRTAEAGRELERALAFWRSVGATACLREAEELVTAVSA